MCGGRRQNGETCVFEEGRGIPFDDNSHNEYNFAEKARNCTLDARDCFGGALAEQNRKNSLKEVELCGGEREDARVYFCQSLVVSRVSLYEKEVESFDEQFDCLFRALHCLGQCFGQSKAQCAQLVEVFEEVKEATKEGRLTLLLRQSEEKRAVARGEFGRRPAFLLEETLQSREKGLLSRIEHEPREVSRQRGERPARF